MGGDVREYYRPVNPTDGRMSSFWAHCHRTTPSREPGVDYYTPIGTEVFAGVEGRVVDIGGSIGAATGRYVTIDVRDGRRLRDLHYSRNNLVSVGKLVEPDTVIGLSGASGYGSEYFGASSPNDPTMIRNTGGPHVHRTLWPTQAYRFGYDGNGNPYTLDFERFVVLGSTAGGGSSPFPIPSIPEHIPRENDVPTFIRTAQHGHYSVAPGVVIGIGNPTFIDSTVYVAAQVDKGPLPLVFDVSPDDLALWLFYLAGCPASSIPAPNYAWYAAAEFGRVTAEGDAHIDLGPTELDALASKVRAEFAKNPLT